jgi:hypothetical protein
VLCLLFTVYSKQEQWKSGSQEFESPHGHEVKTVLDKLQHMK